MHQSSLIYKQGNIRDFKKELFFDQFKVPKRVNSENTIFTTRSPPPHLPHFGKNLYRAQTWYKTSPMVDLSENGSWTYAENGLWTYAETSSWTYAETGSWTYAETGSWTYRKPVRARRQKVQLVLVRLAYGQPH